MYGSALTRADSEHLRRSRHPLHRVRSRRGASDRKGSLIGSFLAATYTTEIKWPAAYACVHVECSSCVVLRGACVLRRCALVREKIARVKGKSKHERAKLVQLLASISSKL